MFPTTPPSPEERARAASRIPMLRAGAHRRRARRQLATAGAAAVVVAVAIVLPLVLNTDHSSRTVSVTGPGATTESPSTTAQSPQTPTSPATSKSASSTPPTSTTSTTGATTPVPAPPCTDAAILAAVHHDNPADSIYSFECSGSFAYAFVHVFGGPGGPADGYEATWLFKANGATWQLADRNTYCPNNAVPAPIYQLACQTN